MTNHIMFIVIDPQLGFISRNGSLARHYGAKEIEPIEKAATLLHEYLLMCVKRYLITSEYSIAQFTEGNEGHPLSKLCVSGSKDCEIIDPLKKMTFDYHTIKHQQDALSNTQFTQNIEQCISSGTKTIIITGFLLEHCVKSTALSLAKRFLNTEIKLYLCPELCGSRTEKYHNGEVDNALKVLESNNIKIINLEHAQSLIHS